MALSLSASLGSCSTPSQDHVATTCRQTGDLLRTLVGSASEGEHGEDLSPIVDGVVDAARSSGEPGLREPAQRLSDAWQDSRSDNEASPTQEFGRAANDLARECVDRGFSYPDIGFE